ncbi:MAG TPA: phosphoribosylamine--glycine ligase [Acidobacteriaceae bacterium]
MKVLVIGGGGREHAIVWALRRSKRVSEVVCAPGNAGIAALARCVPVSGGDLDAMVRVAEAEKPELVVVGPELPLSLGLVDELERRGMRVFGPTKAAARLETSKAFAKQFMQRNQIPTAAYAVCTTLDEVRKELKRFSVPVVVKADGLAAGKGVVICATHEEAEQAAAEMFSGALLGTAEREVVIEEFLEGEEVSYFALCDGRHAVSLAAAQDHKRVGEGDTGPNTGGMGAYTADGLVSAEMMEWLRVNIAQRVVDEMAAEDTPFQGILFCGMMMSPRGPMVLEFNTRFGDPETEAILVRLETDIAEMFGAAIDGRANEVAVRIRAGASVCVIAASGGYPGKYAQGLPIAGLDAAAAHQDVVVFHAGTALSEETGTDGAAVTAGGRVLAVTAVADASGPAMKSALVKAYGAMAKISFEGMQYRRDIGWRALRDGL